MKADIDLKIFVQIAAALLIACIAFYLIANMMDIGRRNVDEEARRIEDVLRKSLLTCYALEGAYPADIYYLEKYGVVFNDARYIYHYDMFGMVNYMPEVFVIPR